MPDEDADNLDETRAACRQFDLNLDSYLEGEPQPEVTAHARECPFCGVLLADIEQAGFASHHLPPEEPPPRVWANIRATLASEGVFHEQVVGWHRWLPRFVFQPVATPVAALACLVLFGLVLMAPPRDSQGNRTTEFLPSGELSPFAAAALVTGLDSNMARTIREMEQSYRARESFLDPALKATYRKSLQSLDECIRECLVHCQRQPANRLAHEYLLNAYKLKAEVLTSALEFGNR